MSEKQIVLTFPVKDGKLKEYTMPISKAEKMFKCRTTSKKWSFKDEKLSLKDGKIIGL